MSLLPQQKKSAGEIGKLRESLGIPGQAPAEVELPAAAPQPGIEPLPTEIPAASPLPAAEAPAPKRARLHKRAERIPVLQVEGGPPDPNGHGPKPIHTFRKSEQIPLPAHHTEPPPDSILPDHRHSDQELNEIRRQVALARLAPPVHQEYLSAHPALIIPGYLFAIAGAVGYYFYDLEIPVTASCVAVALLVAAFIFFKKPFSRHHAAFITVMSLLVVIFGALHYFPQLRHGT